MSSGTGTDVLVVEDERALADLFAMWLADDYDVRTAYTGQEALEQLDPTIDVVLLDRRLPDVSGEELLGRLREKGLDCRVAMVTAVEPEFDLLKLDVDEYVTKPVSKDELRATVETLAERSGLERSLQGYLALVAKKNALERERSPTELRESKQYEILTDELSERRTALTERLTDHSERRGVADVPYPAWQIGVGAVSIAILAALLVGIHLLIPDGADRLLAYGSPRSDLLVAYLASFVHTGDAHLYGNAVGFLVVGLFTYVLCLRLRALGWFALASALLVTVLPIGTTLLTYGVVDVVFPEQRPIFVGFSHVVSGFVGFSFLAFLTAMRLVYDHRTVLSVAGVVLCSTSAVVVSTNEWGGLFAAVAGGLLFATAFSADRVRALSRGTERRVAVIANVLTVGLATGLYAVMGVGIVPTAEISTSPGVIGHLIGLAGGFLGALLVALLLNVFPIRDRFGNENVPAPDRIL